MYRLQAEKAAEQIEKENKKSDLEDVMPVETVSVPLRLELRHENKFAVLDDKQENTKDEN